MVHTINIPKSNQLWGPNITPSIRRTKRLAFIKLRVLSHQNRHGAFTLKVSSSQRADSAGTTRTKVNKVGRRCREISRFGPKDGSMKDLLTKRSSDALGTLAQISSYKQNEKDGLDQRIAIKSRPKIIPVSVWSTDIFKSDGNQSSFPAKSSSTTLLVQEDKYSL